MMVGIVRGVDIFTVLNGFGYYGLSDLALLDSSLENPVFIPKLCHGFAQFHHEIEDFLLAGALDELCKLLALIKNVLEIVHLPSRL